MDHVRHKGSSPVESNVGNLQFGKLELNCVIIQCYFKNLLPQLSVSSDMFPIMPDGNRDLIGDTREEEEKAKVEEENEPSLRDASMESNREVSSLDSLEGNSSTDLEEGCDLLPLFVHFTCTIKQKSSAQQTSVRKVPLCLGKLGHFVAMWSRKEMGLN